MLKREQIKEYAKAFEAPDQIDPSSTIGQIYDMGVMDALMDVLADWSPSIEIRDGELDIEISDPDDFDREFVVLLPVGKLLHVMADRFLEISDDPESDGKRVAEALRSYADGIEEYCSS